MTDVNPKDTATEERSEGNCYVALTNDHLDVLDIMNRVRSPKAGAIVLFAGIYPPLLFVARI
jgi:molybdopterin synthase catalytic subunit